MKLMRLLVSGGAGFIGLSLVKRLILDGHEVVSYDLRPSPMGESIIGDITDEEAFSKAVKSCEHVFHLAAAADLNWCSAHPNEAVKANIKGTRVVAEECAKRGITLSFASTCCVYGDTPDHPSDEESICSPTDIYGATKFVGEELIKGYQRKMGLNYHLLRFGTTYGPGMRPTLAIYIFIQQALQDKQLTLHGSGEQTRCMIYIDDIVEACVKTLKLDHYIMGTTLNIATDEELSVWQMANMILKLTVRPLTQYVHVPDRFGQIMKEQIDISKARKMLDWEPKTSFREGLLKTIEWIKPHLSVI